VVVDICLGGARIQVPNAVNIPKHLNLEMPDDGISISC
jgi:hypothetical protein